MKRHKTIGDVKAALIEAGVPEEKVNGGFLYEIMEPYYAIVKPALLDYRDAIVETMPGWAMDEGERESVKATLDRLIEEA